MMTGGDHILTPVQAPGNIEWEWERITESYEKKNQKVEKRAKTFATHCS